MRLAMLWKMAAVTRGYAVQLFLPPEYILTMIAAHVKMLNAMTIGINTPDIRDATNKYHVSWGGSIDVDIKRRRSIFDHWSRLHIHWSWLHINRRRRSDDYRWLTDHYGRLDNDRAGFGS